MELFKAITLGIIQGLTEFLPISSSGHLVIFSELLDFEHQGVVFDVFLHLGTLFSVVVVFRKDIWAMIVAPFKVWSGNGDEESRMYLKWDFYVILATLPAVFVGLFLKGSVESLFRNLNIVYSMLLITGTIMLLSKYVQDRGKELNLPRSILIGCAQACAIMPGLSRSGSTIFVGMLLGINREVVAKFSFIMSIPAIVGASVLQSRELFAESPPREMLFSLGIGTVVSAAAGYFAIVLLLDLVRRNRLQYFGYYCLAVAVLGFAHQLFG